MQSISKVFKRLRDLHFVAGAVTESIVASPYADHAYTITCRGVGPIVSGSSVSNLLPSNKPTSPGLHGYYYITDLSLNYNTGIWLLGSSVQDEAMSHADDPVNCIHKTNDIMLEIL
jgi:hypothetical protein